MKIIDAHTHIDYITHKIQPGVVGTVVCTTDESQWSTLIDVIDNDDCVYGAFGVHPWFVDSWNKESEDRLESVLKTNRDFFVGEIGLDKYKPNMEHQIEIFQKQFDMAIRLHRGVCVHCVGAWDKILHILKQYKKSTLPNIVFHAFNGSADVLEFLLKNYDNNIYFSFGKNVVYDRNCRIQQIPIDKILVESDGKTDAILIDIINKIVDIKNDKNAPDIIYNNTKRFLKNG